MTDVCPRCLMRFPHHIVVRARCTKRWRGGNFDKAAADGNVGAAVAGVLGLSVRTSSDLQKFYEHAFVRSYGEKLDPNPAAEFDPSQGEAFEFHVGLRAPMSEDEVARVEEAVREAVRSSRHFVLVS